MIYLAKMGKVFGPYSQKELDTFHTEGTIKDFFWLWDEKSSQWMPLDPLPAPPRTERSTDLFSKLGVICHDSRGVVAGHVRDVTETGCELCTDDTQATPKLGCRSYVILNIHNPETGRSTSVPARLTDAYRAEGRWTYKVRWSACPAIH